MADLTGWRMANRRAVPGTGHLGGRYRTYLRTPRNISVKRGLLGAAGSLKGEKVPPNNWDDLHKQSICDRNWKRFRLHRWKESAHA